MLTEAISLLNKAQTLMGITAQSLQRLDTTEEMEKIIALDNHIYALLSRAKEILEQLDEMEY